LVDRLREFLPILEEAHPRIFRRVLPAVSQRGIAGRIRRYRWHHIFASNQWLLLLAILREGVLLA
jgi:hypothetical protein